MHYIINESIKKNCEMKGLLYIKVMGSAFTNGI